MSSTKDGPASPLFKPLSLRGNVALNELAAAGVSKTMAERADDAPNGTCVCWGVPFRAGKRVVLVQHKPVTVKVANVKAPWLVFLHVSDIRELATDEHGFPKVLSGHGRLAEHAADYVIVYADGAERRVAIRRRHQIGALTGPWGEGCMEAVPARKPCSVPAEGQYETKIETWGNRQTRVGGGRGGKWMNWLWAWENPQPTRAIAAIRFEPVCGAVVVFGITAGKVSSNPLRWRSRRKAVLALPQGQKFDPRLDESGLLKQLQLDLGQVISAVPRTIYPDRSWPRTYNNQLPAVSDRELVVEYTAHADARFFLPGKRTVPAAKVEVGSKAGAFRPVAPADRRVTIRIVDKRSRAPVAVKLHVHGEAGEHLPPQDHHRYPNNWWYQDYGAEFSHNGVHHCVYVDGETTALLPVGRVYLEVSKGFEIAPVRKVVRVTRATKEIVVEIEKHLPWRERGWVTADTHVHFLSPPTARLEGAAEGVNVVNLLASQWGELITSAGDFDGKTTFGSREAGGDGEWLVRVGSENRQHLLGHISLLGYEGGLITPMTTAGPGESALGDPVAVLLTEWARQCKAQRGVVVIPHFPSPRCENAATIVAGDADAVEMTSWGSLYVGINPYSLIDWYRYLNCGYFVAAVGGTDKMSASTAVGTIRTYARLDGDEEFSYEAWKRAVRRGRTFATYGPLIEFAVDGCPSGHWIEMPANGGTVDVTYRLASVTVPMSRVELIVSGEVRESRAVRGDADEGQWSVKVDRSAWLAVLVRGHYADQPEMIAAHTSPVMVRVARSPFFAAADAMTILQQIEGALAYLDTVGTRAETARYRQMRLVLTAAHRDLHNRMHQAGAFHDHGPATDHKEHH